LVKEDSFNNFILSNSCFSTSNLLIQKFFAAEFLGIYIYFYNLLGSFFTAKNAKI